ncbi:MAG: hypothetical protein HAW59_00750 [Betaproteobacteria bacterium]|nr:hypothetical protein [Betaproteobacteria bacterium]
MPPPLISSANFSPRFRRGMFCGNGGLETCGGVLSGMDGGGKLKKTAQKLNRNRFRRRRYS